MKKPHLLARCLEPVAMTEGALRVCLAVVTDDAYFAEDRARALEAAGGFPLLGGRAPMETKNGTAVIDIDGPLVRKAAGIESISGLTSYDAIRADLRAALADPAVRSIVFAIDSNGGELSGLFEVADEIHAARHVKPMSVSVSRANSAAYVLAAAVGDIAIEQVGEAGSVGVILGVQRPDADGGEPIYFVSSVSPSKRLDATSDAGRQEYQARVDYCGELLVEKVAAYRGCTPARVKADFGGGSVLLGEQAVAAGMADRIGSIDAVIARVASRGATSTSGAEMDTKQIATAVGLKDEAEEGDIVARLSGLVQLEQRVLAATGAPSAEDAAVQVVLGAEALRDMPAMRERIAQIEAAGIRAELRATLERGLTPHAGQPARLTMGAVQHTIPLFVADEGRRSAMQAAIAKLLADADERKAGITQAALLDAVCSVDIAPSDLRTIQAHARVAAPAAAPIHAEPERDPGSEAMNAMEKTVAQAAARARAAMGATTTTASKENI